jgi:hypothetical protein
LLLTPELARTLLDTLGSPRLAQWKVDYLVKAIAASRYRLSTVKVSPTGRLIDGRHRCAAVVRSGQAVRVDIQTAGYEPC